MSCVLFFWREYYKILLPFLNVILDYNILQNLFPLTWNFPCLVRGFHVAKFTEVSLASSLVWDKAEEGLGMVEPSKKPGILQPP